MVKKPVVGMTVTLSDDDSAENTFMSVLGLRSWKEVEDAKRLVIKSMEAVPCDDADVWNLEFEGTTTLNDYIITNLDVDAFIPEAFRK